MSVSTKNPFGKFNGNEAEYVLRALDSENRENKERPWVQRFEEAFAEKVGAKYAIAVNSGTSGLHAALFAAGARPVGPVTGGTLTARAASYGARPVRGVPVI